MENGYIEIDIKKIGKLLKKTWWLILLMSIIFGGAAYVYANQEITPLYKVTTTIFVGKDSSSVSPEGLEGVQNSIDINDLKIDSQLINDMMDLLMTHYIIDKVVEETGGKLSYSAIRYNLEVETGEGSRFMTISLKGKDPKDISIIMNNIADILVYEAENVMALENARVLDYASVPTKPVSPNVNMYTAFGIVFGMLLGVGIPLLIDIIRNTYKDEEEIKILDIPILGVIPKYKTKNSKKIYKKN